MLYAKRNPDGRIVALTETAEPGSTAVDMKDREVLNFLSINDSSFSPEQFLESSDAGTIRIIEDIVEILIAKNIVLFTDFPQASQKKLLSRKLARSFMQPESEELQDSEPRPAEQSRILIEDDDSFL
ncbi:hypothetical protein GCM10011348_26000 [Marinobacterium nitratireducens]|uniref:Uncharacterized protein n=1 Tax=Marinobacterium nitratireducens TaxID=518897 RepID=A0A917ZH11_9GAMM|nr:hypothetical protein [Marinobacterium nitratireducens]GGO83088.1 hypothetical protein GCM10011348_26000 [Marinobacterium nitratireducens]